MAAYNEADRIAATLAALAPAFPGAPMWVADDGSTDATAEIARDAGARVVRSARVIGKGAAVTRAAREALCARRPRASPRRRAPSRLKIDLRALRRRPRATRRASWARSPTRSRAGRRTSRWPPSQARRRRAAGSRCGFARWAIRRRCGLDANAPISGQRALSAGALRDVLPFAHGYGMEIGMTIDAVRAGYRVVEIELDLAHRASGRTLAGFVHRARQLVDFVRVYVSRR